METETGVALQVPSRHLMIDPSQDALPLGRVRHVY